MDPDEVWYNGLYLEARYSGMTYATFHTNFGNW